MVKLVLSATHGQSLHLATFFLFANNWSS